MASSMGVEQVVYVQRTGNFSSTTSASSKSFDIGARIGALLFSFLAMTLMAGSNNQPMSFSGKQINMNFTSSPSFTFLLAANVISLIYSFVTACLSAFQARKVYLSITDTWVAAFLAFASGASAGVLSGIDMWLNSMTGQSFQVSGNFIGLVKGATAMSFLATFSYVFLILHALYTLRRGLIN